MKCDCGTEIKNRGLIAVAAVTDIYGLDIFPLLTEGIVTLHLAQDHLRMGFTKMALCGAPVGSRELPAYYIAAELSDINCSACVAEYKRRQA